MIKRVSERARHESFFSFKAINDAIINLATNFVFSLQSNDENLDVSLSVPQYSNSNGQQQQSVNQSYHEMADQVNIQAKLRKQICLTYFWNQMEISYERLMSCLTEHFLCLDNLINCGISTNFCFFFVIN